MAKKARVYVFTDSRTEPVLNEAAAGMADSLVVQMKPHIDEANGDVWYVGIGAHRRMLTLRMVL